MNMMETDQDSKYLPQLQAEKDTMDSSFIHAHRLLAKEIDRIESGGSDTASKQETVYLEVHHEPPKPVKKTEKVLIPIKEHPKFNFVGKLLGPKGLTLKRLQEETGTKMAILGKGSMKDKRKEDELRKEGGKYNHLNDELHVSIEVFAPLPECYRRISHAIAELHKYLMPDFNDEIRQQQMEEMMYLNGEEGNGAHPPAVPMRGRGRGRGAPGGPPPGGMGRGRGAGPPGPLLSTPMPPPRGGGAPRGAPPSRGGMSSRGAPTSRGGPMSRGAPRAPVPLGRGGPVSRAPPPVSRPYEEESYGYGSGGGGGGGGMASMSGSGVASYDDQSYGYEEQSYGGGESYDQGGYSSAAGGGEPRMAKKARTGGSDTQYFDYGHGSSSRDEYQEESYGQESWGGQQASYGKAPVARPKPTDYRSHPYGGGNNTSRGRY